MLKDKRVLTIQDISCVGQCSITEALPIISACGIETCILPSAVLSTHTGGFSGYTFKDLTDEMPAIVAHWKSLGIVFDAVYTGYLGKKEQITCVIDVMENLLAEDGVRIVDPAMADWGVLYGGLDAEFAKSMAELCGKGDIILPNITEACLMTGEDYKPDGYDKAYIDRLIERLRDICHGTIILTGVSFNDKQIGVAVHDRAIGVTEYYFHEKLPNGSHGTGDAFAAAFTGAYVKGLGVYEASKLAADFTLECMKKTLGDKTHWYGVKFEKALPMLVEKLNN